MNFYEAKAVYNKPEAEWGSSCTNAIIGKLYCKTIKEVEHEDFAKDFGV